MNIIIEHVIPLSKSASVQGNNTGVLPRNDPLD